MRSGELLEAHRRHWPESFDPGIMGLAFALHGARDATDARARRIWRSHGLTPAGFDVLATLRRSPPPRQLTPGQIREAMLISSGGLAKVLAQLADDGLVARSAGREDARVKPVRLTARGARLVEQAMAALVAANREWLADRLSPGELATLTALLLRLSGEDPARGRGGGTQA
ncbi:MAG: MarR family transcriptional regulator [Rhodocyclaceae bacterium]|nr:MarR family transcriptional regulator [Rhodocyclaceae bacterium]